MEITYKKTSNKHLFDTFANPNLVNFTSSQNYIPLYTKFFNLNSNNYNSINLNNNFSLNSITEKISENKFLGKLIDENNNISTKSIFFKFSPILDPYKYLAGKYDISDTNLFNLPKLDQNNCHNKTLDPNNAAYVDAFFTYLTSQLYNRLNFIHGLDFYGSYLGIKNNYNVNISDDLDMLTNSSFFYKANRNIFTFINREHEEIINETSRDNKTRLKFGEDINNLDILNLSDIENIELTTPLVDLTTESTFDLCDISSNKSINIYKDSNNSESEVSSRSSNTNNDNSDLDNDSESGEESESETSEEENIIVAIDKFPVQAIALETCESTFDELLVNNSISQEELGCIITQILMMLITYQKLFSLTHNDLHTNNIMYITTEKKYLYYKYNGKHYKVKTFGKIFKIIDFGRAIYKYNEEIICSDSFHKDGDAATQYNCEPYYNDKKPLIEPNMSFDLCRLGCSIYDFILDYYESPDSKMSPIHKIITDWCNDDNNINILYKNNNEERYPDFKLYKMIARKVHNHIPSKVIEKKYFNQFIVGRKEIKKGSHIMNIDELKI